MAGSCGRCVRGPPCIGRNGLLGFIEVGKPVVYPRAGSPYRRRPEWEREYAIWWSRARRYLNSPPDDRAATRTQIIDVPEDAARSTFTVTPAPPQTVDHSTPPSVDVEISAERDGVEIVLMETLLADDVDRLIEALRVAKGLAVAESQAAGYFA